MSDIAVSLKHPKSLYLLFFVELWERFSFYGMKGLLIYFMTQHFLYSEEKGYDILGAYGALVYAGPVLGGFLAEKYLGYKISIIIGAFIMMLGHLSMLFTNEFMFSVSLAFIAIGNGFFKPNISSTVGQIYSTGDPKRDAGFTIFYMGINIGAFGQLFCATLGEKVGWHYGFSLAGFGMAIGLLTFIFLHKKFLSDKGLPPDPISLYRKMFLGLNKIHLILLGTLFVIPIYIYFLQHKELLDLYVLYPVAIFTIGYLIFQSFKHSKLERQRIFACLILTAISVLFWAFFEQGGSSISLFIKKNVNRNVFGFEIVASAFQSVNPAFIILLAPIFSILWSYLSRKQKDISITAKFGIGIVLLGLGFYTFYWSRFYASAEGTIPLIFFLLGYMIITIGELCISPVGLSMVTKLAPEKLVGIMMGAWMLSSSFAHSLGAFIAKTTAMSTEVKGFDSLIIYTDVFNMIGLICVIVGIIVCLLSPILTKWMHGVK